MKKVSALKLALSAAAFAVMLAFPRVVSDSARAGLAFCAEILIPSLFVYMVLSDMLAGAAAFFPRAAFPYAVMIAGMICGSPSGADSVRRIYENGGISKKQAECLIAVSGSASASFTVGFAGGAVLGSVRAGVLMLIFKAAVSFAVWAVISRVSLSAEERKFSVRACGGGANLAGSVKRAASAVTNICACVVFFTVAADLVTPLCANNEYARLALRGALEFSGALGECRALPAGARYVAACALIGWQGACVHLQVSVAAGEKLSLKPYFAVKAAETCAMTALGLLTKGLAV
ncbi:MAG: hypothetical protein IJL41_00345 [Clostridia bacterium]|nr:hypothetical protein [Clostridia bacterium]